MTNVSLDLPGTPGTWHVARGTLGKVGGQAGT